MDNTATDIDGTGQVTRKYTLSLKGEGMAVEREIDEDMALEVLGIVMGGGGGVDTTHAEDKQGASRAKARRNGRQSLREYLDEVQAKRNPDKILAIAKYAIENTDKGTVTRNDVKTGFKDAAEAVPGNYGRDFRWVVRNGWLAQDSSNKNEFYVTDTGSEALEQKFSAEIKKKTGVSKGRRGDKRRTKKGAASK